MKTKPLYQVEAPELVDIEFLRNRCDDLARYVRAAKAIEDLLRQAKDKDLGLAALKTRTAVEQALLKAIDDLAAKEIAKLNSLYVEKTQLL